MRHNGAEEAQGVTAANTMRNCERLRWGGPWSTHGGADAEQLNEGLQNAATVREVAAKSGDGDQLGTAAVSAAVGPTRSGCAEQRGDEGTELESYAAVPAEAK